MRLRAPSRVANASRNAQAGPGRRRRWEPARDALWDFLAAVLEDGARVAIVGAGNGDDLPLHRIARRASTVTLIDIDPRAAQGARRRLPRADRRKVEVIGHDVSRGAADAIARAAPAEIARPEYGRGAPLSPPPRNPGAARSRAGRASVGVAGHRRPPNRRTAATHQDPPLDAALDDPLPGAPYDLVVGDLFYSQLLYPALVDLGIDADRRAAALAAHGPSLTRAVVARLHASAPRVVHVHDPLAWWDGHEQPVTLAEILAAAASGDGPDAALALAATDNGPHESDPRAALGDLGISAAATALWRWPFSLGVDYLACATFAEPDASR